MDDTLCSVIGKIASLGASLWDMSRPTWIALAVLALVALRFALFLVRNRSSNPSNETIQKPPLMKWKQIRKNPEVFFKAAETLNRQRDEDTEGPAGPLTEDEIREILAGLAQGLCDRRSTRLTRPDENHRAVEKAAAETLLAAGPDELEPDHVCWVLQYIGKASPPPELADWLIRHRSTRGAKDALHGSGDNSDVHEALAATGCKRALDFISEIVSGPPLGSDSFATAWSNGIDRARANAVLDESAAQALAQIVRDRLLRDPEWSMSPACLHWLYASLDAPSAFRLFLGRPFWSARFQHLGTVLWALSKVQERVSLPAPVHEFAELERELLGLPPDHKNRNLHGEVILRLVESGAEGAAELAQRPLEDFSVDAQADVLRARARLRGIEDDHLKIVWDAMDGIEPSATDDTPGVPPCPVRLLFATYLLGMEVDNGGPEQYFFNSAGDYWPEALECFEAMAAAYPSFQPVAETLRAAAAAFGSKTPPSRDRDKRIKQLSRLGRRQLAALERFADAYDKAPLETARWAYVLAHAEAFRTTQTQNRRRATPSKGF